jgi:predicted Zn-dependent protease
MSQLMTRMTRGVAVFGTTLGVVRAGFVVAGVVVAAFAGCAMNPVTGRPDMVLVSQAGEREIGAEQAAQVEASIGVLPDGELVRWVRTVGARLAAEAPGDYDYAFNVADVAEPNAFALPGGWVYVSRGLLALLNSEDELAGVVGHEIGHVAARHSVQRVSLGAPLAVATGIGAAATSIVAPGLGGLVAGLGGATTGLALTPYGRQQERQADDVGQRIAAAAGWDPAGLAAFLATLESEERLTTGAVRRTGFLASHPATPERAARARALAATLAPGARPAGASDRDGVLARLDGLVVGPDPSAGVVRAQQLLHPALDFGITFPAKWKIVNEAARVGASEPSGAAGIALQILGPGDDPLAAAVRFGEETGLAFTAPPREERRRGLRAARATTEVRQSGRRVAVDLTWIAHAGQVFLVSGVCGPTDWPRFAGPFATTARSFRRLTAAERAAIRVVRLRIVTARAGESLPALVRRTRSVWSPETVAVANAFDPAAPLAAGTRVKIARAESWR